MNQQTEKKQPVRNLERVTEQKFKTYEEAVSAKSNATRQPVHKVKVFARYDGTFDVVWYKKVGVQVISKNDVAESMETAKKADRVVHFQKSKDRKKSPKKPR